MKTLNEKLQYKLDFIRERSKENLKMANGAKGNESLHYRGLSKGYADAFELAAEWIQEIIDYELQDKESIND